MGIFDDDFTFAAAPKPEDDEKEEDYGFAGSSINREAKTTAINRKITPIFFIIDTSTSMQGSKIDTVNNTMRSIMADLAKENESPDYELRMAVLSFDTGVKWETGANGMVECSGLWDPLEANGLTYFNTACKELKDKMSGKKFFNFATGKTITPPVLILLTDGYANDGNQNGEDGINVLKTNKYFIGSYKLAIAIGQDASHKLCENFTGDKELVYTAYNSKTLSKILEVIIKTSIGVSSAGTSSLSVHTDAENDIVLNEPDPIAPDTSRLMKDIMDNAGEFMRNTPMPSGSIWDDD